VLLFVSILHLDSDLFTIIKTLIGMAFMILVAVGECMTFM